MSEEKSRSIDKQKTNDQLSSSPSLDYPAYLDTVKLNLQLSLPAYDVMILSKINSISQDEEQQSMLFSIVLTSPKVYKSKFQIFTETLIDQNCFCFYVRHLVTLNHLQIGIQNKQSVSMALNFCNKINKQMENFRLIIDPVSGKIYFQTKSFINESSLNSLKKHILRQDCFYTEIIFCSTKKAQKYVDIILFLLGQISLVELLSNQQISKDFDFLNQCQQIIQRLQKNIFYISFIDMDRQNKIHQNFNNNIQKESSQNLHNNNKSNKQEFLQIQKQRQDRNQQKINIAKTQILNNSLQFFCLNTEKTITLFTPKNPYQNIDFSIKPLRFSPDYLQIQKTIYDNDKLSSIQSKKILSFIQIVSVEQSTSCPYEEDGWKMISEGGFGIIQLGIIKYKNLSTSYQQPQTGFSLIIKQQIIRKRDKSNRKNKIQRERKILQKLQNFNHPNIMSFYISFQEKYQDCIFSDYTPNMSLDIYLKKNQNSVTFHQKLTFLMQAIQGLLFLHNNKIVHLDIKPGNMLIHKQLRLLLADFGEAFVIGQNDPITHNHAYTIPYCAPQIFLDKAELTQKVDIYAIGVCILKVIMGESFMQTFLKRKFIKRLCNREMQVFGIGQKYEKSFLYPIIRILNLIALKAVSEQSGKRPQLSWLIQVLNQCRNFIFTLVY